jgi:VRR-NUC domain
MVSTYGASKLNPNLYTSWDPSLPRGAQTTEPFDAASPVRALLHAIASPRGRYAGCPDVIAWNGADVLFIESKRRGKDTIRQTQKDWIDAALSAGVALDRFLLAEWTYAD